MTRCVFVLGPGRSGTTLLSELLNRSSRVYIAPETKYFQQVWSQRHLLKLFPRKRRLQRIVDHLIASEYPADPPTLPQKRDALVAALEHSENLEDGFLAMLEALSARPVLGEKTPWHTFFAVRLSRLAPDVRFVAVTRDAPATVASTLGREGFRRVDSINRCIARWIFMNRELIELRELLAESRFLLIRFEDLVRNPAETLSRVCDLVDVPLEPTMLQPTHQDSSLRSDGARDGGTGFDLGVLERWKEALSPDQVRRIRSLTWELSDKLGYTVEAPGTPALIDRIGVSLEVRLLSIAVRLMHSGFYPFGAATSTGRGRR